MVTVWSSCVGHQFEYNLTFPILMGLASTEQQGMTGAVQGGLPRNRYTEVEERPSLGPLGLPLTTFLLYGNGKILSED